MSGVFDKIVEGLPSLPQSAKLPRIISPFDTSENKIVGVDSQLQEVQEDTDAITLNFDLSEDQVSNCYNPHKRISSLFGCGGGRGGTSFLSFLGVDGGRGGTYFLSFLGCGRGEKGALLVNRPCTSICPYFS